MVFFMVFYIGFTEAGGAQIIKLPIRTINEQ